MILSNMAGYHMHKTEFISQNGLTVIMSEFMREEAQKVKDKIFILAITYIASKIGEFARLWGR
jgi:hypothetical protein